MNKKGIILAALCMVGVAGYSKADVIKEMLPRQAVEVINKTEKIAAEVTKDVSVVAEAQENAIFAKDHSDSEIEAAAINLFEQMIGYAGQDYESFSALFIDTDEESIRSNYNEDWSDYYNKDQHFATVVCKAEPYYGVNITAGIVAGSYPNTHANYTDWSVIINEDQGRWYFKCCADEKDTAYQRLMDANCQQALPEGFVESAKAGRNATEFGSGRWYRNKNHVLKGNLNADLKFLWQDEEGDVWAAIMIANGTGGNRNVYDIRLTVTDDTLGTVIDTTCGQITQMAGTNDLYYWEIPAHEVMSGNQTWTSMHSDVHYSHL